MPCLCILWDFVETPEGLLIILDNSKEYATIVIVPNTIIFAVKTKLSLGNYY